LLVSLAAPVSLARLYKLLESVSACVFGICAARRLTGSMADANAESIQQKIQIARRDAEALKDRIKRKKDELADTTCECSLSHNRVHEAH